MQGMDGSQFRENAIIRNANPEPLDDRAQLTAPREWAVVACLGLAMAALVAWGVLGNVERTLRSDGVLVLSGERHTVLSSTAGLVTDVLVQEGERVVAGQPVAVIAPSHAERLARVAAAYARALRDELAALGEGDEVASPASGLITATLVAPGETVPVSAPVAELVSGDAGRLDAVTLVTREDSWLLAPALTARVVVESPAGVLSLPAEVAAIAPHAADPPRWLARMLPGAGAGGRGYFLRLTILEVPRRYLFPASAPGRRFEDGTPCRIEIILERASPFGLLIRR